MAEPTRGTCVVCGITREHVCGCHDPSCEPIQWADVDARTLCLACCAIAPKVIASLQAETAQLEAERDSAQARADKAEAMRIVLAMRLDQIEAEFLRLTTWHPKDYPPNTDRYVLVALGDGDQDMDRYFPGDGRWEWHGEEITHWRELPPGPEVTT